MEKQVYARGEGVRLLDMRAISVEVRLADNVSERILLGCTKVSNKNETRF